MWRIPIALVWLLLDRSVSIFGDGIINFVVTTISKVVTVIILLYFFVGAQNGSISKNKVTYFLDILLICFFLGLSTIINGGDFRRYLMTIYPIIGIAVFTLIYCRNKIKTLKFLNAVSCFYLFIAFVNLLLVVPNFGNVSEGAALFGGGENLIGYPLITGMAFSLLYSHLSNDKWLSIVMSMLTIVVIFGVFSGTTMVGFCVFLLFILPTPLSSFFSKISLGKILLIFAFVFYLIFIIGGLEFILSSNFVDTIIQDILGKNLTLTNRTLIWSQVIADIISSPVFGYGMRDTYNLFYIYTGSNIMALSAHNQVLQSLYEGGILFIVSFIPIIHKISNALKIRDEKINVIIKGIVLAILIMFMGEAPGIGIFLNVMVVAFSVLLYYDESDCVKDNKVKRKTVWSRL